MPINWWIHKQIVVYGILLCYVSHFSRVRLCNPIDGSPPGSPNPWDSPGKNTGVGCHFLLQCMKVKSENEVAQCPTPSDPMDCSLPGSSVHGIFQARVLEWGAIASSLLSHKKEWSIGICDNMDEPWKHFVQWNKPVTKNHILFMSIWTGQNKQIYYSSRKQIRSCLGLQRWDERIWE